MASIGAMHARLFPLALSGLAILAPGCALTLDFDRFDARDGGAMDAAATDGETPRIDGCTPADETCNGEDDDCDGRTDEQPTECSVENGSVACSNDGVCGLAACDEGWDDCHGDATACEARLDSRDHCSACDARCGATQACADGGCRAIEEDWAIYLQGTTAGSLSISDLAALTDGAVAAGTLSGPDLALAGSSLGSPSGSEIHAVVFRVSDDGDVQWTGVLRNASVDVQGIAVDASGNAYVVGRAAPGTVLYGLALLRNESAGDGFIVSVAPDGTLRWGHHYGQAGGANDVVVGPTGDLWIGGLYQGELRVDAQVHADRSRARGGFLVRQRANGAIVWIADWDEAVQPVRHVAVDAANVSYVMGATPTSFVVRAIAEDGTDVWSTVAECPNGFTVPQGLAANEGVVLFSGRCMGEASIGGTLVTAPFLAALDASDGSLLWARTDVMTNAKIHAAPGGGFVRVGDTGTSTVDFGYGALPAVGNRDAVVERLTASGEHVWGYTMGSVQFDTGADASIAPDGAAYVVGSISESMTFAGTTHTEAGGSDGFLVRLRP